MITAVTELAAEGLKFVNIVETNLNRPDMIAEAIKRYRQKHRDTVDAAQAILANPKASQRKKDEAFGFIQRIES